MGIVEVFFCEKQIIQNYDHEDLISLLAFLAQQPIEMITDLESSIKLMYSILSQLNESNFKNNYLSMLHNLKTDCLHFVTSTNSAKIFVKDKFMFKLLLLLSLKYRKNLFIDSEETTSFVYIVVEEILDSIDILKYQSLYLLKFLEMILKKREDFLTPTLSLLILKTMNKAAYSPLTGFKNSAQNVSRNILRSLPHNTKKFLCNFYNLSIKGIDLNDILKQFTDKEIIQNLDYINLQILKLFCNNTDSRDGSFYYETILNIYKFDDFVEKIWPYYKNYLTEFDEGEFYQSFLKYFIPITVKRYDTQFFKFIVKQNVDWHFQAFTLLETRKRSFCCEDFYPNTITFLQNSKTSNLALKIICTFIKKQISPDKNDLKAIQFYLNHYFQFELFDEVTKPLKQLFSQIFLFSHTILKKNDSNLKLYTDFFIFIYKFCFVRVSDIENCEGVAQLLKIVWDIAAGSSSDLVTSYKIDRENFYKNRENLFYKKLNECEFWRKTFRNKLLVKKIEILIYNYKFCPKLIELVKERYLDLINLEDFKDLVKLPDLISQSVCLQSSEKIRVYTDLIISYRKLHNDFYGNEIIEICKYFHEKMMFLDSENMFICVLILDMLIIILNYEDINIKSLIEKSFLCFNKIFDDNLNDFLNVRESKILESFINNVIECLFKYESHWYEFEKDKLFNHFCKIIQVSNMKRPVQLSANFINTFGGSMTTDEDRLIKIKLLYRILNSLYYNKQNGKIRRNPETRLVIHALCLGDKNLTKPFLVSSLNFMLEVLENPLASDITLASTLHSLEVLVSDNSFPQLTLPFMVDIIRNCIRLFNKSSWIIRNADLQLLKSLIERFLGVCLIDNTRPKTIEDLFTLFPILNCEFYQILSQDELGDSAVIVLLFFSESQIKNDSFIKETLNLEKFRFLFAKIIKNYSNNLGYLAIKAFTALCTNTKIPQIITEIVYYLQQNFVKINKNVFVNLIKLLQELYNKYKSSLVRKQKDLVTHSINALITYLRPFNCFYFNLLSLKLFSVSDIVDSIASTLKDEIDYKKRLWLNNYIAYVVMDIDFSNLGEFLKQILFSQIPEFLQIKILSVIIDRFTNINFSIIDIINILIQKLCTISKSQYLIMSYAKTILLLSDVINNINFDEDLIIEIRQDFHTDSIYKIFVYVLVLANCYYRNESDNFFISKSLHKYIEYIGEEDEILSDLSTTIIYLYKIVSINERFLVIKIIFLLLLNEYTCSQMCKFMSWLTNSQSSSVLISFVNLLDYKKLIKYVGDNQSAVKLLSDFYCYVDELPEDLEESDTYYLIENYSPLSKQYLKAIIVQSLENVN